jgi:hypothetical protein
MKICTIIHGALALPEMFIVRYMFVFLMFHWLCPEVCFLLNFTNAAMNKTKRYVDWSVWEDVFDTEITYMPVSPSYFEITSHSR